MLKNTFFELLATYSADPRQKEALWDELEKAYTNQKRHYHTLRHLEHLLLQLTEIKGQLENWEAILFTLFYHDIIYKPLKSDNEERSAAHAVQIMQQLAVPADVTVLCREQILATKSHQASVNSDTNYFTDADLSILGSTPEVYARYCQNVRKEYAVFPDFIYRPGRKKVLKHFLAMEKIFKTDHFFDKFERNARRNLAEELRDLTE
ncbi:hypothetical protein QWY85_19355 [Neolewinella lacunae]|uniref:Metal-dependent HD superfamily phosphohydrolase n=1 Tax=Neolewinella lacunae TaxID=1517758 RepID=A0A923PFS5_9BACT|nr:hypothetical protein [Neolewinella lacunae]MBC6993323.1 hypothetical protein [Neolewinella lacunae]MDN3636836.1 hypothetical protein [Neolewinella lacunae]